MGKQINKAEILKRTANMRNKDWKDNLVKASRKTPKERDNHAMSQQVKVTDELAKSLGWLDRPLNNMEDNGED